MASDKPEWFEISEGDQTSPAPTKKSKRLPIVAAAAVGAIILGGAFFANANDEPNADASTTTISGSAIPNPASSASASSSGAPTIASVPQGNSPRGADGFRPDGDHRDGFRPDGDHRDGFRPDGDHHHD